MFPAEDGKTWEPYKIRPIKKQAGTNGDVEMGGTGEVKNDDEDEEAQFEEDLESDEGAVYPLGGNNLQPPFRAY